MWWTPAPAKPVLHRVHPFFCLPGLFCVSADAGFPVVWRLGTQLQLTARPVHCASTTIVRVSATTAGYLLLVCLNRHRIHLEHSQSKMLDLKTYRSEWTGICKMPGMSGSLQSVAHSGLEIAEQRMTSRW